MSDGTQQRLGRKDNKPRIHIVYETEVGDAIEQRELPFVLGVLADLAGDNKDQKPLHERDFIDINRDNFDEVMARLDPRLTFTVDSTLPGHTDEQLAVELAFASMKDFDPDEVARKVTPLRDLLETRERLKSLLAKAVSSRDVASFLGEMMHDASAKDAVAADLAADRTTGGNDHE